VLDIGLESHTDFVRIAGQVVPRGRSWWISTRGHLTWLKRCWTWLAVGIATASIPGADPSCLPMSIQAAGFSLDLALQEDPALR